MGGQQSSRRLTVDNEDTNNVIKVSEKVVERLKGSVEEGTKQTTAPPNPPRSFNPVQVHPQKLPIPAPNVSQYEADPVPVMATVTTTALEVKKQYEEEIRKNNEYWQNRIRDMEVSHERINSIWHNEYKKTIEDAEQNPRFILRDRETLPCNNIRSVVIDCYKKNPEKPLLCANEVQAFSDCVNSVRSEKSLKV